MKFKTALLTATALGLMAGTAWAGDSNTLYISQDGTGNTADIHQSGTSTAAGTGNDIGLTGAPVVQDGGRNYLGYTNSGYGAGTDNDIAKLRQLGDDNYFSVSDSNGAAHTDINNVRQDGNVNQMTLLRGGEQYSTIDTVRMDGNNNSVYVKQGPIYRGAPVNSYGPNGDHNNIDLIKIVGNNNGDTSLATPSNPYNSGIYIQQTGSAAAGGSYNTISEASIQGDNNTGQWTSALHPLNVRHAISIYQEGSYNGRTASVARIRGSYNELQVSEVGDWNNFDVRQGDGPGSDNNFARVTQTGSYNSASAAQYGSGNFLLVNQNGNSNTSSTLFTGDDNGVGTLTGAAGALDSLSSSLTQGTVVQDSSAALNGNMLDYNVHGSRNLFAFAQLGGSNTIDGKVGTGSADSNENQAAVLQNGSYNTTSFSQTGAGGNNLAVSQ